MAFRDRLAWIHALNARALREHHRDDLTLHLTYGLNAKNDLRELVRREQACCAFLRFEFREELDLNAALEFKLIAADVRWAVAGPRPRQP